MVPALTDCSAAADMRRVFKTSAGVVVMDARAPAKPPIAMISQSARSRPLPPDMLPAHAPAHPESADKPEYVTPYLKLH